MSKTVMKDFPLNHPLRRFYRFVAVVLALVCVVFGALAFAATSGRPFFTQTDVADVMGLRANPAGAVLALAVGVLVLIGIVIGRTVDHWTTLLGGTVLVLAGLVSLLLARTGADVLAFGIPNCAAALVVGALLMNSGAYVAVGSDEEAHHREAERYFGPPPAIWHAPRQRALPEAPPSPTEPVTAKPVETEPVETEPVETEPVATEPVATEPVEDVTSDDDTPVVDETVEETTDV